MPYDLRDIVQPYIEKTVHEIDLYNETTNGFVKTRFKATVCEGELLKAFTGVYEPQQNEDIINPVLETFDDMKLKAFVDHVNSYVTNRSMRLKIVFPEIEVVKDPKSPTFLTVILANSYDGSSAATLQYGYYRLICTNGAVAFHKIASMYNKHTSEFDPHDIKSYITKAINRIPTIRQRFLDMQYTTVGEANGDILKRVQEIMPAGYIGSDDWTGVHQRTRLYDLYQTMTWYVTHEVAVQSRYALFGKISNLFEV